MTTRVRAEMPVHPAKIGRERVGRHRRPVGSWAHHNHRSLWTYPTDEVRTWVGAMLVECTLACFVLALRSRVSMGARALLVAGLMFMGGIAMVPFAMSWLLAGTAWMVLFGAAMSFAARLRASDAR